MINSTSSNLNSLPLFSSQDQFVLSKSASLLRVFEDIHNHVYANDGLSPEQALGEIIKILFIKIFDEKNKGLQFIVSSSEYSNIINGQNDIVFLDRFEELQKSTYAYFSSIFEIEERIKLRPATLAYVVNKLQSIDLSSSSNDVKGLAFQKFITSSQRIGRGQFFTPEQVIKLCVDIIQPKPCEFILDPACGSAGFLSYALKYISLGSPDSENNPSKNRLYGIEINSIAARIAKMRMILDDDGFEYIIQHDSLSDWSDLNVSINLACNDDVRTYQNYFDVILTNPPFGTQGRISNKSILKNYDLGYKWTQTDTGWLKTTEIMNGQVPEILFIERALNFLKPGGRMAIVLPNGDFENSSLGYLRFFIQKQADLIAIIQLPQETFIPSGTGVKTSVLFLKKKGGQEILPEKLFFGNVTKLGYLGNKNGSVVYKKDNKGNVLKDNKGNSILDEDFSEVVQGYHLSKSVDSLPENDKYFVVNRPYLDLSRFDLEFYKPHYHKLIIELKNRNAVLLGELIKLRKIKSHKLRQKELIVNYVELSDISTQYNEIINSTEYKVYELPSRASYELREGQLITAVAGNSIGTTKHVSAIVSQEFDGAICTNGFRVLIPDKSKVNPYYLLHYFNSNYFLEQVYRYRTGSAIPAISDEDLLNILILLPEKEEQNRIGDIIYTGFQQRKLYTEILQTIKIGV